MGIWRLNLLYSQSIGIWRLKLVYSQSMGIWRFKLVYSQSMGIWRLKLVYSQSMGIWRLKLVYSQSMGIWSHLGRTPSTFAADPRRTQSSCKNSPHWSWGSHNWVVRRSPLRTVARESLCGRYYSQRSYSTWWQGGQETASTGKESMTRPWWCCSRKELCQSTVRRVTSKRCLISLEKIASSVDSYCVESPSLELWLDKLVNQINHASTIISGMFLYCNSYFQSETITMIYRILWIHMLYEKDTSIYIKKILYYKENDISI